jgi:hypothetical protein
VYCAMLEATVRAARVVRERCSARCCAGGCVRNSAWRWQIGGGCGSPEVAGGARVAGCGEVNVYADARARVAGCVGACVKVCELVKPCTRVTVRQGRRKRWAGPVRLGTEKRKCRWTHVCGCGRACVKVCEHVKLSAAGSVLAKRQPRSTSNQWDRVYVVDPWVDVRGCSRWGRRFGP